MESKTSWKTHCEEIKNLRRALKKKRLVLDEQLECFGCDLQFLGQDYNDYKSDSDSDSDSEIEVKGFPYKVTFKKGQVIAMKIIPIESKFNKKSHPCYMEGIVLKELTDNLVDKSICPHITSYLGVQRIHNNSIAMKKSGIVKKFQLEDRVGSKSILLLSEYVNGGSLNNWVYTSHENYKGEDPESVIDSAQWKILTFQLLYSIRVLQLKYKLMHNDFHCDNILIDTSITPGGYIVYTIDNQTYYIPNTGIIPKLWDFEFSMMYNDECKEAYPNHFVTAGRPYDKLTHYVNEPGSEESDFNEATNNVPYNFNEFYDTHYFLTSLLDLFISHDLFNWIIGLYPTELVPEDSTFTNFSVSSSANEEDESEEDASDEDKDEDKSEESDSTPELLNDQITQDTPPISELSSLDEIQSNKDQNTQDTKTIDDLSSSSEIVYMINSRMKNGVEKLFSLPTPKLLLQNDFFKEFTTKPSDFEESKAIYFSAD